MASSVLTRQAPRLGFLACQSKVSDSAWRLGHESVQQTFHSLSECLLDEHFNGKCFRTINAQKQWCLFSFPDLCLPKVIHSLASSGDFLSTEKSLPLLEEACTAMRSRWTVCSCVGLSYCTAQCINYEPNHRTSPLTGSPFLLGYQMHSTETTERKGEDQDAVTDGNQLVSADIFNHLGS